MDLYRGKEYGTGGIWLVGTVIEISDRDKYILLSDFIDPERPAYNGISIGCGLEDNCITDRYQAAEYGWMDALERYEEKFPEWVRLEPETVTRCTEKRDKNGFVLFEGDIIQVPHGIGYSKYEIRYGHYAGFDTFNEEFTDTVGFYMVSDEKHATYDGNLIPFPLGYTELNAELIGNVIDNPQWKVKK